MRKNNKDIKTNIREITKNEIKLSSQELEALQYMKKCGKLDMVNVQTQADMKTKRIFKHESMENQ